MIYLPLNFRNFIQFFNNIDGIASTLIRPAMDIHKSLNDKYFDKAFFVDENATYDGFGICVSSKQTTARIELNQVPDMTGVEVRTYHVIGGDSELVDIEYYSLTKFAWEWPALLREIATKDIDAIKL